MYNIEPNHLITVSRAAELERKIEQKVREVMDQAHKIWPNLNLNYPTIRYDLRGVVAGYAYYQSVMVKFNPILAHENEEDFLRRTVPHECAHLISYKLYGYEGRGHGPKWKSVMTRLGCDPSRCHQYDVSNARVKKKQLFDIQCNTCKQVYKVTMKRINKLEHLLTRCCGARLSLVAGQLDVVQAKVAAQKEQKKKPLSEKQLRALDVIARDKSYGYSTNEIVSNLSFELGISVAYARTMYYTLHKL